MSPDARAMRLPLVVASIAIAAPFAGWAALALLLAVDPGDTVGPLLFLAFPAAGLVALVAWIAAAVIAIASPARRGPALVALLALAPPSWALEWLLAGAWVVERILDGPWTFMAR